MGIRIHRAMGWGMSWADFQQCNLLYRPKHEKDYGLDNKLWDLMEKTSPEELTVPEEEYRRLFYTTDKGVSYGLPILERSLLSYTYTAFGQEAAKLGPATELFTTTGYEGDEYILFFPNLYYGKKWYRHNDDLDYTFDAWRGQDEAAEGKVAHMVRGEQGDPRELHKILPYNPYPWTNDLMLEDGTYQPWDHYLIVEKHPEWLPAVPNEIRWYLPKLDILKIEDVLKLRPMIAQWWG